MARPPGWKSGELNTPSFGGPPWSLKPSFPRQHADGRPGSERRPGTAPRPAVSFPGTSLPQKVTTALP